MPKKVRVRTEEETNLLTDIKNDWRIIKYMENPSMLLIKAAIKAGHTAAVEVIACRYMTPELATYIVEREIHAFKFIPDEFKTPELSLKAVTLSGRNLEFVPNKTQEICTMANNQSSSAFQFVPIEFRDEEVYYKAIQNGSIQLKDIPVNNISKRMCLTSVKQQSTTIDSVPKKYKTLEFYLEVFESNKNIFKNIPKEILTDNICTRALNSSLEFIRYIPKELQTDKMCLMVLSNPRNLNLVNYILSDSDVVKKKIKRLTDREAKMKKMYHMMDRGGYGGHGFGFHPMMMDMMMDDPIFDYIDDCEEKIENLSEQVDILKKQMEDLMKVVTPPTNN